MPREKATASSRPSTVGWAALLLVAAAAAVIAAPRLRQLGQGGEGQARGAARPASDGPTSALARAKLELAAARRAWQGAAVLAPHEERTDASGQPVRWFQGFGISVESTPGGARVLVNGQDLGETPLVASVSCSPGDPVEIELRKPRFAAQRRTTTCRVDALVGVAVALER
jgi:PEGA domain